MTGGGGDEAGSPEAAKTALSNAVLLVCSMVLRRMLYGRKVAQQPLHPEPVFILGHPRTGTTHLHNLLAMDPRFAYANTFQVGASGGRPCLLLPIDDRQGLLCHQQLNMPSLP